jgi:hypothetical protein
VSASLDAKRAAFEAHRTQHDHRPEFERLGLVPDEWFALASGSPFPANATDVFAGL